MKRIIVNISCELNAVPNLEEELGKEIEATKGFAEKGILEHSFIKPDKKGAVLVFKEIDEIDAQKYTDMLPLAPYFTNVEYEVVIKAF